MAKQPGKSLPAGREPQHIMNESVFHKIFEIGVLLKGAHALIECIGGMALALVSVKGIARLVSALTQDEPIASPMDFIGAHMLSFAQSLTSSTVHFYAFYLLSHGAIKLFLVYGLLKGRSWAYPSALIVLGLFVAYQLYRFSYTHSPGLMALTAFDAIVMALIWFEYRQVRRHQAAR